MPVVEPVEVVFGGVWVKQVSRTSTSCACSVLKLSDPAFPVPGGEAASSLTY